MSSIDERVVEMKFQNGAFERGIAQTSKSLADFKDKLNLDGAAKGLEQVSQAAANMGLDGIASNVANISSKFSSLGAIGFTVIQSLTNSALGFGKNLISNVLDPIVTGGRNRAQNIEQAKFMLDGLKVAWEDIQPAILGAVKGTAFGLDEAAKAASSLVASGVPLSKMEGSLRGISGVAAMTNSSYGDIAQVFTTVAGNGRLMASELNRIGQRGLNAAAALAKSLGVTEEAARKMTSEGKISFEIFAKAMNDAYGEQATKANDTYAGSLSNVRAALARIGQTPAEGKFERLRLIFNALTPVIDQVNDALKPFLEYMKEVAIGQGRFVAGLLGMIDLSDVIGLINGIANGLKNIRNFFSALVAPVGKAWKAIFPPSVRNKITILTDIGKGFERLTEKLVVSDKVANVLQKTFEFLFGGLAKVGDGVRFLIHWVGVGVEAVRRFVRENDILGRTIDLFKTVGTTIADAAKKVVKFVKESEPIQEFFENFMKIVKTVGEFIGKHFINAMNSIHDVFTNTHGIDGWIQRLRDLREAFVSFPSYVISGFKEFIEKIDEYIDFGGILDSIKDSFVTFGAYLAPIATSVRDGIVTIINGVTKSLSSIGLDEIDTIARLAGNLLLLWQAIKTMKSARGMMDGIGGFFEELTAAVGRIGQESGSTKFVKVAAGIAILAAALWLISLVPADKLWQSVAVIGGIALAVLGITKALDHMGKNITPAQVEGVNAIAKVMLSLAFAVGILAASVWVLSQIDEKSLWNSAAAIVGLLTALSGAMVLLIRVGAGKGLLQVGTALLALSGAMLILAFSIKIFNTMSWEDIGDGLMKIAAALVPLVAAAAIIGFFSKGMAIGAAGIVALAASIVILAFAIKQFADIDSEDLTKGVVAVVALLAGMAGALALISRFAGTAAVSGMAMIMLAGSMYIIAQAVSMLASHEGDVTEAAKALGFLTLTLGVVAAVLGSLGKGAFVGAGAFAILAVSLIGIAYALTLVADVPEGAITGLAAIIIVLAGAFALMAAVANSFMVGALIVVAAILALAVLAGTIALVAFAFTGLVDAISNFVTVAIDAFERLGPALSDVSVGLDDLMSVVSAMSLSDLMKLGTLTTLAMGLATVAIPFGVGALLIGSAFEKIGSSMQSFARYGEEAATNIPKIIKSITGLTDGAMDTAGFALKLGTLSAALLPFGEAMYRLGEGIAKANEIGGEVNNGSIKKIATAIEDIMTVLNEAFEDSSFTWSTGGEMAGIGEGLKALSNAIKHANKIGESIDDGQIEKIADAMENLMEVINKSFDTKKYDVADSGDAMGKVGKGLTTISKAIDTANEIGAKVTSLDNVTSMGDAIAKIMETLNVAFNPREGFNIDGDAMVKVGKGLSQISDAIDASNEVGEKIKSWQMARIRTAISEMMEMLDPLFSGGFFDGGMTAKSGEAMAAVAKGLKGLSDAFVSVNDVAAVVNEDNIGVLSSGMDTLFTVLESQFSSAVFNEGMSAKSGTAMESVSVGLKKLAKTFTTVNDVAATIVLANILALSDGMDQLFTVLEDQFSSAVFNEGMTERTGEGMAKVSSSLKKMAKTFRTVNDVAAEVKTANITKLSTGMDTLFTMLHEQFSSAIFNEGMTKKSGDAMEEVSEGISKLGNTMKVISGVANGMDVDAMFTFRTNLKRILETLSGDLVNDFKADKVAEKLDAISPSLKSFMSIVSNMNTGGDTNGIEQMMTSLGSIQTTLTKDFSTNISEGATATGTALTDLQRVLTTAAIGLTLVGIIIQGAASSISSGMMSIRLAITSSLKGISANMPSIGLSIVQALASGIRGGSGIVASSTTLVMLAMISSIRSSQASVRSAASTVMNAFISAVGRSAGASRAAGTRIGTAFTTGLRSGLSSAASIGRSGGYSVGVAVAAGAESGIRSGTWGVVSAITAMADEAVAAAKARLDVRSPSRVFNWIGQMVATGAAMGVKKDSGKVADATENLGSMAIKSMQKSISGINDILDLTVDMSPTIRPLLDLTEIQKSSARLNDILAPSGISANVTTSMVDSYNAAQAQRELDRSDANNGNGPVDRSFKFEQNIYSPKALSTVEIYRTTNNLVSKAKKVGDQGDD